MWCVCLYGLFHVICKLRLQLEWNTNFQGYKGNFDLHKNCFYEPQRKLQQGKTKTDSNILLNNQILDKIDKDVHDISKILLQLPLS